MLPFWSTACGGRSTKLPGRAPAACPGVNKPPGAASNIEMFRTSPTPATCSGFGRLSGNAPWNDTTLGCDRNPIVSALISTNAYGNAASDFRPDVARLCTAILFGPVPGNSEQADRSPDDTAARKKMQSRFET